MLRGVAIKGVGTLAIACYLQLRYFVPISVVFMFIRLGYHSSSGFLSYFIIAVPMLKC